MSHAYSCKISYNQHSRLAIIQFYRCRGRNLNFTPFPLGNDHVDTGIVSQHHGDSAEHQLGLPVLLAALSTVNRS